MSGWQQFVTGASAITGWEVGQWIERTFIRRWMLSRRKDAANLCAADGCAGRDTCRADLGYGLICGDDMIARQARAERSDIWRQT